MTENFSYNASASRYEYHVGDAIAFAKVRREGRKVFIDYVEAPPELRGTGAAGKLMHHVMDTLRAEGVQEVVPICGYAASWIAKNGGI